MIAFGIYNAMLKPLSAKLSISSIMFGLLFGAFIMTLLYSFFVESGNIVEDIQKPSFWGSVSLGLIWSIGLLAINISLGKMGGNVAQIAPVINAAGFVSLVIAILVFKEAVVIWKVMTGAALIFAGTLFLL